jgi:hypothetical protein
MLTYTLGGCNASKHEILVPVSGTIKVDGKPLTVGWITFYPDEAAGNTSSRLPLAQIAKDGTYELTTNSKPGALPGFYKVVVVATHDEIPVRPKFNEDGKPRQPKWLTHEKYTRPQSTDVQFEVVEQPAPRSYDLDLAR